MIRCHCHTGMDGFTMNYMVMSTSPRCQRARAQAMSSTTRMSSQRYIPRYPCHRQRGSAQGSGITRQRGDPLLDAAESARGDYRTRKSALATRWFAGVRVDRGDPIGDRHGRVRYGAAAMHGTPRRLLRTRSHTRTGLNVRSQSAEAGCGLRRFTTVALEELRRFPGMREDQGHGNGGA